MSIEIGEFRINHAIARVADHVEQTGQPFVFDRFSVGHIRATGTQPFLDAFNGIHSIERERIEQGIQRLTFKPDRTYGFTTTGFGR